MVSLLVTSLTITGSLYNNTFAEKESEFPKDKIAVCERINASYKKMSDVSFHKKYSFLSYVETCIKLYKEPIWKYVGKDRIDKIYARYLELAKIEQKSGLISGKPYIEILSKAQIGDNKYHVKLKVCPDTKVTHVSKILLKSDMSQIEIPLKKDMRSGFCMPYQGVIMSKSLQNIQAFLKM
jgi:hypothetical protein